jgi:phosphate transport system ATP-binding protein
MKTKISIRNLNVSYDNELRLNNLTLDVPANRILGVIGPAGSGKTTFLRSLNRMIDLDKGSHVEGSVFLDENDIYQSGFDVIELRKKVGMVFALPVPLPMSIYNNVVYGPTLSDGKDRNHLDELVERSLRAAFLWDEVKDRLNISGLRLSGGQQQRLCLARTLAMQPDVILLDEPCSGLDPISTAKIEEALTALKERYTIILVTNNTKQAARVSDFTGFFLMGELIEMETTNDLFTTPRMKQTDDYITGRFG